MSAEAALLELEDEDYDAINVVVVHNPLEPHQRKRDKIVWQEGKTLEDYLEGLPESVTWCVCHNDQIIQRADWAGVRPAANDFVTLVPVPEGGGSGGKQILRIVALIAVAVAATYTGGLAAAAFGTFAGAAATAAVTIAGGLLVNALLPATTANNGSNGTNDGLTYGIDGPKNTSGEEYPVPVIYGEYMTAGNIVDIQVQNDGDTQYLYMRSVISEGPIDFIDTANMLIENQKRGNYQDVDSDFRLGTDNQTPSSWFNQTKRYSNVGEKLDTDFYGYTTLTAVQGVGVDIECPNGLAVYDSKGNRTSNTVNLIIQYQSATIANAPWIDMIDGGATVTGAQKSALRRSFVSPTLPLDTYNVRIARASAESTNDLVLDQVYVSDFVEILNENIGLNFTAWYAIKVLLTDQLSKEPEIMVPVRGRLVNQYDARGNLVTYAWSNNPAWITLDILTNPDYGAGMALTRFDMAAFSAWAVFCASNNLVFNGVFDQVSNVWDSVQQVCRVGHASIVMGGTQWTVAMEAPADPVQMFGVGNIFAGSLEIDWLDLSDRANEVEIAYYDANDQYRRHTVRAVDGTAFQTGQAQRLSSVEMLGVTSNTQAWMEANFQLNLNKYLLQTVIFDAPIESIACAIGDVILVSHDMPEWGYSGRLEPAGQSINQLTLDRPIAMVPGTNYQVLVMHPAVQLATVPVSIVAGNSVYVPVGQVSDNATNVKNQAGVDSVILGVNNIGTPPGTTELILADGSGFAGGDQLTYWRTNKIDTVAVINPGTGEDQTVIQLAGNLTQEPIAYANWMFGPVIPGQKPFRVQKIEAVADYKRTITALEYNASVYTDPLDPAPTPNYSILPTGVGQVTNVQWWEEVYYSGPSLRDRLIISWSAPGGGATTVQGFTISGIAGQVITFTGTPLASAVRLVNQSLSAANIIAISGDTVTVDNPAAFKVGDTCSMSTSSVVDGTYAGADIQISTDGVNYTVGQHVTGSGTTGEIEVLEGQTLYFRIVPFDGAGAKAPANLATVFTYGVVGKTTPTNAPSNLIATSGAFESIPLSWTGSPDPDVAYYEIWESGINDLSTATVLPDKPTGNSYTRNDLGMGETKFYWVRAFDHQGRASLYSNPDTAGSAATTSLGITGQQIASQAIDPTNLVNILQQTLASFEPLATAQLQNYAQLGTALANIAVQQTVTATSLGAIAKQITTVQAQFDNNTAAIQQTLDTEVTARQALATLMNASIINFNGQIAQYQDKVSLLSDGLNTTVQQMTDLSTTVNGNTTQIQEQKTSINGLEGIYALQINTNGTISGFGLASDLIAGKVVSTFAVEADNFYIVPPGANVTAGASPFYVQGESVYIQKAMIAEVDAGAIKSGVIEAQDITIKGGLVVEDLSGNVIFQANADPVLGNLGVAIVGTGNIATGANTAMVAAYTAATLTLTTYDTWTAVQTVVATVPDGNSAVDISYSIYCHDPGYTGGAQVGGGGGGGGNGAGH